MLNNKLNNEQVMARLDELIAMHLHKGWRPEFYIKHMQLGTAQLERCVRAKYGISMRRYLIEKRNAEAYRLLLQSDLHIKEIAFAVGFASGSAFCGTFKVLAGTSPQAYRKAHGINVKQLQEAVLMNQFYDLIDGNLERLRTATQYANALNVCMKTLDSCVRNKHGIGLGKYLQQRRAAEALRLLKETELPIKEISRRIGFSYPSTLSKAFKASGAVSPKEMRVTFRLEKQSSFTYSALTGI